MQQHPSSKNHLEILRDLYSRFADIYSFRNINKANSFSCKELVGRDAMYEEVLSTCPHRAALQVVKNKECKGSTSKNRNFGSLAMNKQDVRRQFLYFGKYAKGCSQLLSTVQVPVFACNASITTTSGLVGIKENYRVLSYFYFMIKNSSRVSVSAWYLDEN